MSHSYRERTSGAKSLSGNGLEVFKEPAEGHVNAGQQARGEGMT